MPPIASPKKLDSATLAKSGSPTLLDVARLAGTSKGTASRALNGKHWVAPQTRDAVLQAARELGFQADPTAQVLANGRSDTQVGLFVPFLDLGVLTLKLQLLQSALNQAGFDAPIHASGLADPEREAQALINLCRQRPAAIVCFTFGLHDVTLRELERYCESGGIAVCYDVDFELKGNLADCVVFDRTDNTYQATRHLVELGHKRIGIFSSTGHHAPSRLLGFNRGLREGGITMNDEFSFVNSEHQTMGEIVVTERVGHRFGAQFVALKTRPTAMVITDDYVAAGFVAAVQQAGLRVPRDVSVVGHDNMPIAGHACAVPLTTVSQPVEEIAREAARMVSSRLNGQYSGAGRRVVVRGELIRRESTAALR